LNERVQGSRRNTKRHSTRNSIANSFVHKFASGVTTPENAFGSDSSPGQFATMGENDKVLLKKNLNNN